jgi:predicted DNA-binding antitoxin AbrB/MazE fold protein
MERIIEAVFENGMLRPLTPVDFLDENGRVTLTVTIAPARRPLEGWVGGVSDADAAQMQHVIQEEFERVDPDEWK